ncbi:hypothetical protein SteCoe_19695 [Stentor coeruleus]|uniref:Uncharacterized protein n=1 Tax=Stentor coeruleus TaxID=5963 RepID=A0A1R2BTR8_9CILI|nr:hypothetical protein SteCoe_19695 [Stentor coeruleus]
MYKGFCEKLHVETTRYPSDIIISPSEMTPELATVIRTSEIMAMRKYEELINNFYQQGVPYNRQILIKSLTEEWQMYLQLPFSETYKIVCNVSNTLLLNELEIIYWSILLKNKFEGTKPALYAYFTAFLAKSNLNSDVFPFEICLNSKIPNFRLHYNNWQLVFDFPIEITVKDLNARLRQLNEDHIKGVKDYELMVRQLMQIPRRKGSNVSEAMISEISVDCFGGTSFEDYEIDLLLDAKNSPINKLED